MEISLLGLRVVRGPDWCWADQDGGEGFLGTVVDIGRQGSATSPDKTVVIQWDSGGKTNYRVGYQSAFDIRIFDNAQTGVRHRDMTCSGCKARPLRGVRWSCSLCHDIHLCSPCYMSNKHDLTHRFTRIDYPGARRVELGPRQGEVKLEARGIFVGAKVVRGVNWDWGNQDGGVGKIGTVVEILDWESESGRSVARITWQHNINVYRLGHKGKMDLKLAAPEKECATLGGCYYRDHLSVLGGGQSSPSSCKFQRGDDVLVDCSLETLQTMQEGHGGWNEKMAEYLQCEGVVHRITDKGDVRVQFPHCSNRWTFHPEALTKISISNSASSKNNNNLTGNNSANEKRADSSSTDAFVFSSSCPNGRLVFKTGDPVRLLGKGLGVGWRDDMIPLLGHTGLVTQSLGSQLTVQFHNIVNPASTGPSGDTARIGGGGKGVVVQLPMSCCQGVPPSRPPRSQNCGRGSYKDLSPAESSLDEVVEKLSELRNISSPERLVREAAQGRLEVVVDILTKFPGRVDAPSNFKTALQVASHEGRLEVVKLLLQYGARMDIQDDEGDTPLHYACFGNQPTVAGILLQHGADVNSANHSKCTALHVSVNKQYLSCVQVLLQHGANVNLQDSYGDAALHDAIGKPSLEIVEILIASPQVDLATRNVRKFNCLHFAALKGQEIAVRLMVAARPDLVDVRKDDGFAALHLAALNGHTGAAEYLLDGGANPDIRNRKQQTALHLAVSQGYVELVQQLITKGCSLECLDEESNCCLHSAISTSVCLPPELITSLAAPLDALTDRELGIPSGTDRPTYTPPMLMLAFLLQKGVSLSLFLKCRNKNGKTPQDSLRSLTAHNRPRSSNAAVAEWLAGLTPEITSLSCDMIKYFGQHCLRESVSPDAFCMVCQDDFAEVIFKPCDHKITCSDCSIKMKRCLRCQEPIRDKIKDADHAVGWSWSTDGENMRARIQHLEETIQCNICMDVPRSVAFMCGHTACATCAAPLENCHLCRKLITQRINLF